MESCDDDDNQNELENERSARNRNNEVENGRRVGGRFESTEPGGQLVTSQQSFHSHSIEVSVKRRRHN